MLNSGMQNFSHLVQGEHFQVGGIEWTEGVGKSKVSRSYFRNGERYGQGYY